MPVGLETLTQPCKGCRWLRKPEESLSILSFAALLLFAFAFSCSCLFEEHKASKRPCLILPASLQGSKSQHFTPWSQKNTDLDKRHAVCIPFSRCLKINITSSFPSRWAGINYEASSWEYSLPSEASSVLPGWFCPKCIPRGAPDPCPIPIHAVVLMRPKISISISHCLIRLFSQLDMLEGDCSWDTLKM